MSKKKDAMEFLYKAQKSAKIAMGYAETRPGVTREELENLQRKIDTLDWIIPLVIKAEDE